MNKQRNRNNLCVNHEFHFSQNPELSSYIVVNILLTLASNY